MAVLAVRHCVAPLGDNFEEASACDVLRVRHRLKVCRITTGWSTAEVVEFQPVGHRPDESFVDHDVYEPGPAKLDRVNLPIALK